ncbi:hypothetical protein ABH908_000165 [Pseudomonas frederiksbergensis]|uniref:hypothetical protein n=1 Tax=Pseudomonas TaxID=286 RepID=UPI003D2453DD
MSEWRGKVETALRKLKYSRQRKRQLALFWSSGAYGWIWSNLLGRRSALDIFEEQAIAIEWRIMRIEDRYWRYWSSLNVLQA